MAKARVSKKVRVADRVAPRPPKPKRSPRLPADVIRRRTRRRLADFVGILSPEAAEDLREAIDEGRKERERLDRERLKWVMEAFGRLDDAVALETARRRQNPPG